MSDNQDPMDQTNLTNEPTGSSDSSDAPLSTESAFSPIDPAETSSAPLNEEDHADPLVDLEAEPTTQSLDPEPSSPFTDSEFNPITEPEPAVEPSTDLGTKPTPNEQPETDKSPAISININSSDKDSKSKKDKSKPSKDKSSKRQKSEKPAKTKKSKPAKPAKNRRLSTIIISVLITLLLLAGIAAALWYFVFQPEETKPDTDNTPAITDTAAEPTPATSAELIIDEIQTALHEELDELYEDMQIDTYSPDNPEPLVGPGYKVDMNDYYVQTETTYGLTIDRAANSDANVADQEFAKSATTVATDTLKEHTYKKVRYSITPDVIYESADVICSISDSIAPIIITCADKSAYQTSNETILPYYTAYESSDRDKPSGTAVFGLPKSSDSHTEGYELAELTIGQATGLFYRQVNGDWQYFTSTQQVLSCDEFDTEEIQAAYASQTCIDPGAESSKPTTVRDYFDK